MLSFALACTVSTNSDEEASPPSTSDAVVSVQSPASDQAFPEDLPLDLPLGVIEVHTPPGIARIAERRVEVPNRQLDVRVDTDRGTYPDMAKALSRWGFTVRDADGETARVMAPPGERWAERIEVLPGIARVADTLSQDHLPDGASRRGTTRFDGGIVYAWSVPEGGLVETIEGVALPRKAELPRALPTAVVRCLAPVRSAIIQGEPAGPGWERALRTEPLAWVAVFEHYGACDATGWFVLEAMAPVDTISVAGAPARAATDEKLFIAAQTYLSTARARTDDSAIAAADILRRADDARLAQAIAAIAPGPHQERLLLALAERNEAAAVGAAKASASPTLRTWGASVDDTIRRAVLADDDAPADALLAAMAVWRPGADESARLEVLKSHVDRRVRMKAWDIASEQNNAACMARLSGVKALDIVAATALYAECPQPAVRLQSLARLSQLDAAKAAVAVQSTLEAPETVRAGVTAVRAANALERDDLLEGIVANPLGDRDVRAEALRSLLRVGRSAHAAELFATHGPFLGVRAPPRPK